MRVCTLLSVKDVDSCSNIAFLVSEMLRSRARPCSQQICVKMASRILPSLAATSVGARFIVVSYIFKER